MLSFVFVVVFLCSRFEIDIVGACNELCNPRRNAHGTAVRAVQRRARWLVCWKILLHHYIFPAYKKVEIS